MNRPIDEYRSTTNRYVYNRVRKLVLEKKGLIRCRYCGYHIAENENRKSYTNYVHPYPTYMRNKWRMKYPNWKLVSKNKKQWMKKPLKKKWRESWDGTKYFTFEW